MLQKPLIQHTCEEFMLLLSGKNPFPGGGGAAALGGALGMGLANMVASLTQGKEKYAQYEEEITLLLEKGLALQKELLALVDEDARVFAPLAKAYGLPAASPEEKAAKKQALAQASYEAALVPLQIAEKICQAMPLVKRIGEIGTVLAISDIGCSILFLQAALGAARYNVLINLPQLDDLELEEEIQERLQQLLVAGEAAVADILSLVDEKI